MVKHLLSPVQPTVQFQDNNPGCMWGMLQILRYHNVKKVFPHKKHHSRRHARYEKKAIMHSYGISDDQQSGDADVEPLLVRQHSKNVSATAKSLPRGRKKGLHVSKQENSEERPSSSNARPQLPQVDSIYHLDSSDNSVQFKAYGTMDAIDYSRQKLAISEYALSMKKEKDMEVGLNRDVSNNFKEHADVLELFRVEKDLLLKFLRELDVGRKNFKQASNTEARLTKSGSFPLATSSQKSSFGSSSLEHKRNEIWAFPKGEKLLAGTQPPKMSASKFGKEISYMKSVPLVSDHSMDNATEQKPGFSSVRTSQGLNHKGWNQLVLHRFKVIKQKLKHALLEFTKNGYQTSVEAIHNITTKSRFPKFGKEVSQSLEDGMTAVYVENRSSDDQTKVVDNNINEHKFPSMRRTPSLNDSLDRYTHLFEQSFGRDIKWHNAMSKSIKLTNDDKIQISEHAPKLTRRNMSLPNLESLGFILHEAFCDANDAVASARNSVDHNRNDETDIIVQRKAVSLSVNKDKQLDPIKETETREVEEGRAKNVNTNPSFGIIAEENEGITSDHKREGIHKQAVVNGSFAREKEEIDLTIHAGKDVMEVLETSLEDITTSHAEGTTNTRGSSIDELETDLPNTENIYSLPGSPGSRNASATAKDTNNSRDYYFALIDPDAEKDPNFKYVKDILEYSGFMENEHNEMWCTIDQPLKPSLFKDLEDSLHQEIECCTGEVSNHLDHQLIFNVVNEVLLEINERSTTYFPRPFSFNSRLHPMLKGHQLLKEIWVRVNSYLSLRPELDQTLDDVVGRDLAKNTGWMNLQWEEEYVALELEEMIMEDLLDEVIFS